MVVVVCSSIVDDGTTLSFMNEDLNFVWGDVLRTKSLLLIFEPKFGWPMRGLLLYIP